MGNENLLAAIFVFGAGFFSILGSIFNWDWFFNNRKAYIFVKLFGRNGARVFYIILGSLLIILGFKIFI